MADTRTIAQRQRGIRQDALREWLAQQGLHSQAVELISKIPEAQDAFALNKLDTQIKHLIKLSNKYIPDLKSIEAAVETEVYLRKVEVEHVRSPNSGS